MRGAITEYIDVAQLTLYAFWLFFAGLIIYLRREDKREGYPLDSDRSSRTDRVRVEGFPTVPPPKAYRLADGSTVMVPRNEPDRRPIAATPTSPHLGAALQPTGDPMQDAVGPASYAARAEVPDMTLEGQPKIVPLRVASDFHIDTKDKDPRGWPVIGADGKTGGTIADLWIDRSEPQVRYIEVAVASGRHVLLPAGFAKFDVENDALHVHAILGGQFDGVPAHGNPDQVTRREEDRISAYYGGGILYAEPSRLGPQV
jgi:photosynthetic reaction center H subunit